MNRTKIIVFVLTIVAGLVGLVGVLSNQFTESIITLGKVLIAFFPLFIAALWFYERKTYLR